MGDPCTRLKFLYFTHTKWWKSVDIYWEELKKDELAICIEISSFWPVHCVIHAREFNFHNVHIKSTNQAKTNFKNGVLSMLLVCPERIFQNRKYIVHVISASELKRDSFYIKAEDLKKLYVQLGHKSFTEFVSMLLIIFGFVFLIWKVYALDYFLSFWSVTKLRSVSFCLIAFVSVWSFGHVEIFTILL